jgi:predicted metal-dependent phosphotriesterase family hydrolase
VPNSPNAVAVSRNGQLLPEALEVLKVIAKYDLGLSTGHVSTEEALLLIRAAKQAGVNKIYVQHPNHGGIVMSMAQMKEAVRLGALIEIVLSGEGLTGGGPKVVNAENPVMDYGPQKMADIRALGPANVVLSTDLGQPGRVNYAQAFQMAMTVLARSGFSQAEIDMMTRQNPARFLGLK